MVGGTIGERHCTPGGGATGRADPIAAVYIVSGIAAATVSRVLGAAWAVAGHPLVTRHEFEVCERVCSMTGARQGGGHHGPFEERLSDDHE